MYKRQAWTEGTGYVPPRKDVAEAENGLKDFLAENTMMNAAIEQMDGVVSWTAFPGDAGLEMCIRDRVWTMRRLRRRRSSIR